MSEIALPRINSFASVAEQVDVSPSEQTYLEPLEGHEDVFDRLAYLDGENSALKVKLEAMQKDMDCLNESFNKLLDLFHDLKEDHKVVSDPTKKTTGHIEELHRLMIEEKTKQVSIAKAARLLGISKERVRQLKPLILADGRFEMGWSTLKGQKGAIIRIRKYLK